jgi:TRAP-type C4-dicarboxylate transport system substrate-binding protein
MVEGYLGTSMRKLLNRRRLLTTTMASALTIPHIARAAPRIIKLGHNSADTSQYGAGALALAAAVAQHPDLANEIKIEVHGNAEFGDEAAMLRA